MPEIALKIRSLIMAANKTEERKQDFTKPAERGDKDFKKEREARRPADQRPADTMKPMEKPMDQQHKKADFEKQPDREDQGHPAKEGMHKDEMKDRDVSKQANEDKN